MKKVLGKKVGILFLVLVFLVLLVVPVFASEGGIPQVVRDARQGVVRIVVYASDGNSYIGTGFAIGEGKEVYIVTNHHVIEDAEEIYILYDTGKYVEAEIEVDDPVHDLCILNPKRRIPDIVVLPLHGDDVESGIAVYALGFPGTADQMGAQIKGDEVTIDSSKDAITMTNGVISAIRESYIFGDGSAKVKAIQTNTSISGGNSGGPLLDSSGKVVGINTMGFTDGSNINGCVHVSELRKLLKKNKIDFITGDETITAETGKSIEWVPIILIAVAVISLLLAIVVQVASGKKKTNGQF